MKFPHSDSSCITNEEQNLKFRPSVAALHNRLIKTSEILLRTAVTFCVKMPRAYFPN